jgi:hypothetical protein
MTAAVVGALAALSIPFAIQRAATTTRTAEQVNEVARIIDDMVEKKVQRDRQNNKSPAATEVFSPEYVNNADNGVRGFVFKILNEYEYICAGANLGIFREDVIIKIRGDGLMQTWKTYAEFITHRRKLPEGKNAWNECDSIKEKIEATQKG